MHTISDCRLSRLFVQVLTLPSQPDCSRRQHEFRDQWQVMPADSLINRGNGKKGIPFWTWLLSLLLFSGSLFLFTFLTSCLLSVCRSGIRKERGQDLGGFGSYLSSLWPDGELRMFFPNDQQLISNLKCEVHVTSLALTFSSIIHHTEWSYDQLPLRCRDSWVRSVLLTLLPHDFVQQKVAHVLNEQIQWSCKKGTKWKGIYH